MQLAWPRLATTQTRTAVDCIQSNSFDSVPKGVSHKPAYTVPKCFHMAVSDGEESISRQSVVITQLRKSGTVDLSLRGRRYPVFLTKPEYNSTGSGVFWTRAMRAEGRSRLLDL